MVVVGDTIAGGGSGVSIHVGEMTASLKSDVLLLGAACTTAVFAKAVTAAWADAAAEEALVAATTFACSTAELTTFGIMPGRRFFVAGPPGRCTSCACVSVCVASVSTGYKMC